MNKIIRYNHIPGSPLPYNPKESFVRAMNNEEVIRKAKADPDAPLIDPKSFRGFKRVNS